jgi:hypothetical protein
MFRKKLQQFRDQLLIHRAQTSSPKSLRPGYRLPNNKKLIVSLTSFGKRIESADLTLNSLLQQSLKPSEIILWLAWDEAIPESLKFYESLGVSIRRCEDLKSYTKLVPSLIRYPDDVIVTADDDTIYPRKWLSDLVRAYLKDPNKIHCHRAHFMTFDQHGLIKPYRDWLWRADGIRGAYNELLPTGVGGVLYPPNSLHADATNVQLFTELSPKADDIWFRIMALLNGTMPSKIRSHTPEFPEVVNNQKDSKLGPYNVGEGGNDEQLRACLRYYNLSSVSFSKN